MVEELRSISEILELGAYFEDLVIEKRSKLPYQINLIDELRAVENAHSRILVKLISYSEGKKFPFLEIFFALLGLDFGKIMVKKPVFTAEKHRIDALISDRIGQYSVIIENKVHGAIDQEEQIEKYINNQIKNGFKYEQIFVVYLTKEGGSPSLTSLSNKKRNEIKNRYIEINFNEHIIPWIEEKILPTCHDKDILLVSAIHQYVDHLKGMLNLRKIEKNMNQELKDDLAYKLNLNEISDKYEKIKLINAQNETINVVQNFISELQKDTILDLFEEWSLRIIETYPNEIVTNLNEPNTNSYLFLGIRFNYRETDFACAIGLDNFSSQPYIGLTMRNCTDAKEPIIEEFVNNNLNTKELNSSARWYGYKLTDFDHAYSELEEICDEVMRKLPQ